MAYVLINNTTCSLHDENDIEFLRKLDNLLSYKIIGTEYIPSVKNGYWDGINRILTRQLEFPYGLMHKISNFYKENGKILNVINNNIKSNILPIDIRNKLSGINKDPFPYQYEVVEIIKNHDCGIIRSATGSGKTLIAALITAYFGKLTIIYVIGKDLLYQLHGLFSSIFDDVGIIGDGLFKIGHINIVSVWTAGQALCLDKTKIFLDSVDEEKNMSADKYKMILDLLKLAKVHIWDEAHLASCATIQEIAKIINPEHIYGMSASPYRDDNTDLLIESILGPKIVDISASRLIREGYLVKPYIRFIELPKMRLAKQYQTVYNKYIINNEFRNNKIITGAEKLVDQGFQTLVLYSKINHGKILFDGIKDRMPTALLSGKDSIEVRKEARAKLENGDIKCIVASTIFDIGVDIPSLSGLIVAGGGKSSVRACQRVGRIIRNNPGKTMAAVVDFIDNTHFLKDHSMIRYKVYSSEEEFDVKKWKA